MKKKLCNRLLGFFLAAGLALSMPMAAYGETSYGSSDWNVSFTEDNKMESTFRSADLDEVIYGMQPGDNVIIELQLRNKNPETTDWYMTNEILYSLEDRSANLGTNGGAYTYKLTYTDKDGEETPLFDSDTVGGEGSEDSGAGEGLHQATNALEEYLYLDTLAKGDKGRITLEVALDGETQGNDYQDTLADLQMNFAVELTRQRETREPGNPTGTPTPTPTPQPSTRPGTTVTPTVPAATPTGEALRRIPEIGTPTAMVQTGDDTSLDKYILAACISGGVLLVLSIYGVAVRKKGKEE